jgi:hypothetical protein
MRYWLGPWTWSEDVWQPPAGCRGLIDLRPLPAQARAGGTPLGVGLFALDEAADPGPAHVSFGIDPGVPLTVFQRLAWEQRVLGAGRTLAASNLREALWESLTNQADPTGQDRPMPLVPNTRRRAWELRLAGQLWKARAFDSAAPEAPALQTLLQNTYRRLREDTLGGIHPADYHRKVLGGWVRKYALSYRWFQPADVPDEPPLDPETTYTDDFDTADSDTLGNLLTWTETGGDFDNVSNQARGMADGAEVRAEHDLSGDDHYAQALAVSGSALNCVCARFSASARTFYFTRADNVSGGRAWILKSVSGTRSVLASTTGTGSPYGKTHRLECDGSELDFLQDGSSVLSTTDTSITGTTRGGLRAENGACTFDDFEMADLSAFDPSAFAFPGQAMPVPPPPRVASY